jgi:tetratricopeptide (TPR) repeat protein
MPLIVQNENTLREALTSSLNLFVGAGFSVLAKDKEKKPLPVGNALRDELVLKFGIPQYSALPLPKLYTIIAATRRDELREYLKQRFLVADYSDRYKIVTHIATGGIFTTNIDNLIPLIYKDSTDKYLNDVTTTGPSFGEKSAVDYIPLHGSVTGDARFVFSPTEIASTFTNDRDRWSLLIQRLRKAPTLFAGYSLEDASVLEALNPAITEGVEHKPKWISLRQKSPDAEAYFAALGFNIIIGSTDELLEWIAANLPPKTPPLKVSRGSHPVILEHSIPNVGTAPVRPIRNFYMGSVPTWQDIFSGRIFKTHHYDRIIETINSKKSQIVLGMFASGKTTLMMQVASGITFKGHKLVCSSLTPEKAALIIRALNGEPALIFLDDVADSIMAFLKLIAFSNVQVIGFERDYTYERVSHLVSKKSVGHIECTDLTDEDLQGVFSNIPPDLRKFALVKPQTEGTATPSLYEMVESNMTLPKLSERFAPVLRELEKQNVLLHDFLVMCSYVHNCRTPVSFDMAYGFLKADIPDYSAVYAFIEGLKSFVVDYSGVVVDDQQDHFVPRSTIISNAVLSNVRPDSFKRMLLRFHTEVSPYRIVRFDVFRRRGFDEYFATKAFGDWKEGVSFYETLVKRDDTPYLKQQAALYLMHRKRFKEAFAWIDRAIEDSKGRIPSIRHSYARILFRANINAVDPDLSIVSQTLKESMDILTECYRDDERKNYHALTFADQALQYWNVYRNDAAIAYLMTARKWLREQNRASEWHRGLAGLLRDVSRILDQNPPSAQLAKGRLTNPG